LSRGLHHGTVIHRSRPRLKYVSRSRSRPTLSNSASLSAIHLPTGHEPAPSELALRAGTTLCGVLDTLPDRPSSQVPLSSQLLNPSFIGSWKNSRPTAASAGADGVLATDLRGENGRVRRLLQQHHLSTIFLGAPTSTDVAHGKNRRPAPPDFSTFFWRTGVYRRKGCTAHDLPALLRRARSATKLPNRRGLRHFASGPCVGGPFLVGLADAAVRLCGSFPKSQRQSPLKHLPPAFERVLSLKCAARHGPLASPRPRYIWAGPT